MLNLSDTLDVPAEALERAGPASEPPPLPESARVLSPASVRANAERADSMFGRLAAGDFTGAVLAAQAFLLHQPLHPDALDCLEMARSELRSIYVSRLGSLDRVPHPAMGYEGLLALALDFRAGLVLARVDGGTSLAAIVDSSALPPLEALRVLSELALQGAIAFD